MVVTVVVTVRVTVVTVVAVDVSKYDTEVDTTDVALVDGSDAASSLL